MMKTKFFLNFFATYLLIKCNFLMAQNFNGTQFRNGDIIPQTNNSEEWLKAGENKQPAWCYMDENLSTAAEGGKLYNWYAVSDPRGLCPVGWHIPSKEEWETLINFLGGQLYSGPRLKSKNSWTNINYTDPSSKQPNVSSGFNAKPFGWREYNAKFLELTSWESRDAKWWTSTVHSIDESFYASLGEFSGSLMFILLPTKNSYGRSVRCIKD
jgi:uncharacterized protein (TIGR02145 family)